MLRASGSLPAEQPRRPHGSEMRRSVQSAERWAWLLRGLLGIRIRALSLKRIDKKVRRGK